MIYTQLLSDAIIAAVRAGEAILGIYDSEFSIQTKADNSPLTLADKKSHDIIRAALSCHDIGSLSEEGREIPYSSRKQWHRLWIVDPLDGTKEFIKRNGEFTVNIALVEDMHPVLGVIYAPVNRWLYFALKDIGSFKVDKLEPDSLTCSGRNKSEDIMNTLMQAGEKLPISQSAVKNYTIVGSRSHGTPELETFVAEKKKEKGNVKFIAAGSSLKICLVAEGAADIYPRLGPTMEWDTAAGQVVAECAGAKMVDYETRQPLHYNKPDLHNPWFVVER